MSETIITACVSGATAASPVPNDYVGILVPNATCDVVAAHSVSEVQTGMTVVRVLNTTENDIELLPGQHLGEFHSTSSSDSIVVEETCCTTSNVHSDAVPPVQIDEANLKHSQAQSLKMLLKKYSTVFSMHSEDRGRTGIIKHRIRTGNATPIKQRAYRATPEQRAEIRNRVDELLKADIIEESFSPWAAPVVLVRKKDGTWRFCLDYRKLNAVTIKDSHPLPRVDDALDALSGSAWFSTMDLQHGYWQVEVEEQDREKNCIHYWLWALPFQSFATQKHRKHETVVAYASHVLTKAERRWSTYDRELWPIVWAVRHFRHYLYKQPFVIVNDHKPLVGLRKIPIDNDRTGRRARWALELDCFEWTVLYREGPSHSNADALSRCPDVNRPTEHIITSTQAVGSKEIAREPDPVTQSSPVRTPQLFRPASQCSSEVTSSTFVLQLTEDELREKQQQDPFLSEVMSWKARVPDQRATTVAKCLFENYIREHGIPETLHTDQGRQSDLIRHLCKLLGVQKTRTSPYHPQGDGMVERFNRTLIDQLAKSLLQQPGEWDDCLNQVALAYNTCSHATTGFSPFFLAHGREARMPANLLLPNNLPSTSTPGSPADYAAQLTSKLQLAFQLAAQNREYAHRQQKQYYDKLVKHIPYNPGDLVWLNDPTTAKHKLAPHWKGPFEILECLGSDGDSPGVTCRIRYLLNQSDKSEIVHYNRLKPYLSSVPVAGCDATAFDLHKQPQLPRLTALSGALPSTHSKSPSTRNLNVPVDSQVPLSSGTCPPQVQAVDPQEHLLVDQSLAFPPDAVGHSSDVSVRPVRRQVKLPSYLKDYVLT
ncbi:hypothetical protein AOLI_G00056210 [Acnodon oligacanthus]